MASMTIKEQLAVVKSGTIKLLKSKKRALKMVEKLSKKNN